MQMTITKPAPPGQPVYELAERYPDQGEWSSEDFFRLPNNRRLELIEGRLEELPMPTVPHQVLIRKVSQTIEAAFDGGIAFPPGVKLRIPPKSFREPDVLYLTDEQYARTGTEFVEHATLVVEVVSPDDPRRDYIAKRQDYAAAGVPEYWIVDPARRCVTLLVLQEGEYVEEGVYHDGDIFTSTLAAKLIVDVRELFDAAK